MTVTRRRDNLIETSKVVRVPRVGVMVRVSRKSLQGEEIDVEYRWLPMPAPATLNS
jgi:hypothetical protein